MELYCYVIFSKKPCGYEQAGQIFNLANKFIDITVVHSQWKCTLC